MVGRLGPNAIDLSLEVPALLKGRRGDQDVLLDQDDRGDRERVCTAPQWKPRSTSAAIRA